MQQMNDEILDWLINQNTFKKEYENLLLISVSSQFAALSNEQSSSKKHQSCNWNYLLQCASFLSHSKNSNRQDIALRISQFCLQNKDSTTPSQKSSAQFILNALSNRRTISLAQERGLLKDGDSDWQNSFLGNRSWIKQEIENSIWLKNGDRIDANIFQKSFWDALNNFQKISISAPTSAGKSYLVKQWLLEKIAEKESISIVYLVPTRALISEVELDFQRALSEDIKSSGVVVTSFPFTQSDKNKSYVYIFTQERLQLLLSRTQNAIDILIVDEAYKLADNDRGILLQHVVEKAILANLTMKLVFISPTASNPEVLVDEDELSYSKKFDDITVNQNLIWATQKRGKKWSLDLCHFQGKSHIGEIELSDIPNPVSLKLPMMAFTLGQDGGNIIYVNGAAEAEKTAQQLRELIGHDNVINDKRLLDLIELCEKVIHKDYRLIGVLKYGIAFHYGNIPLLIKEEIESLFRDGVIKFLVCTSTLIEGVNLPCKNIFIRAPKKGRGNPMSHADFWNLAGRAGRWGKEFQGNIICLDPSTWGAPEEKKLIEIGRATEEVLKAQQALVDFIEKGTPRDVAASKTTLESMASYLAINYRTFGSIKNIPWMQKIDEEKVEELDRVVGNYLIISDVPETIVAKHPGISPLAMREMLIYFEKYEEKERENLLVPFASDTDSVQKYVQVLQRIFNRLTNQLGKDGAAFRAAIVTVHWMQGRSISRIIQERQKALKKAEEVHITIRSVLEDIESIARYKAPKFLSCYNDLLKYFFLKVGNTQLANEIVDDIALYLEMGVNTKTQLSLLNLGLSRTSAVEVKEFIISNDLSEMECINWFIKPLNDWRSLAMPEIVKREIEKILKIHT